MEEDLKSDVKLVVQEFVSRKSRLENYVLMMERIICSGKRQEDKGRSNT